MPWSSSNPSKSKPSSKRFILTVPNPPPALEPATRALPWVELKYVNFQPSLFPKMIGRGSPGLQPGDWVDVYTPDGTFFGNGFYNPDVRIPLRIYRHGHPPEGPQLLLDRARQAARFRKNWLRLDECTDACRVIHGEGDGLGGWTVDRYGPVLAAEFHSLGIFRMRHALLQILHEELGTTTALLRADAELARREGFAIDRDFLPADQSVADGPDHADPSTAGPSLVKIKEYGVRYEVDFRLGHKTGFFCDQRENRRFLARFVEGRELLDLCCYTGGFLLAAKVLGKAGEAVGVDLDEKAIAQAKRNANLNQVRADWVHTDAFAYARQMQRNGRQWPVVILDPPKLILDRAGQEEGWAKYRDLNAVTLPLVEKGGLWVTCSCSGLLSEEAFEELVVGVAHRQNRRLQIFHRSGAGPDHPTFSNCPETRYLKVLWCRVW